MTFKDLKTQLNKLQPSLEDSKIFERLRKKPFWIRNQDEHRLADIRTKGDCCSITLLDFQGRSMRRQE